MKKELDKLENIRREIKIRNRKTPFIEGVFVIKHPMLLIIKPRVSFVFNKKGDRVSGRLMWLNKSIDMKLIRFYKKHIIFQFRINIIDIDMVVDFYSRDKFEGFFDTPIGHLRFSGSYLKNNYSERR